MVESASGASGADSSSAASAANAASNDPSAAENQANVDKAVDAAKTAAEAAAEAVRACNDPAAAQAAADRAKAAAEAANQAAEAVVSSNNGLGPGDGSHETSDKAAMDAAQSARDAQAAADSARTSRCEGVPMSQSQPVSPTQGLALGTIKSSVESGRKRRIWKSKQRPEYVFWPDIWYVLWPLFAVGQLKAADDLS